MSSNRILRIGHHISKHKSELTKSIPQAIKFVKKFGFDMGAFQIYVSGPNDSKECLTSAEKQLIKEYSKKYEIYAHASHLDHLFGKRNRFTRINIKKEIEICQELGIRGLVVHLPRAPPNLLAKELMIYADNIRDGFQIYLETEPRAYSEPGELVKLFRLLPKDKFRLAMDTAHVWAAGVDIQSYESVQNWIKPVKEYLGMVQLNDQKWDFGSHSDQHMSLGEGTLYGKYGANGMESPMNSSIRYILELACAGDICVILERKNEVSLLSIDYGIISEILKHG